VQAKPLRRRPVAAAGRRARRAQAARRTRPARPGEAAVRPPARRHRELELVRQVSTPEVLHLRYRVVRCAVMCSRGRAQPALRSTSDAPRTGRRKSGTVEARGRCGPTRTCPDRRIPDRPGRPRLGRTLNERLAKAAISRRASSETPIEAMLDASASSCCGRLVPNACRISRRVRPRARAGPAASLPASTAAASINSSSGCTPLTVTLTCPAGRPRFAPRAPASRGASRRPRRCRRRPRRRRSRNGCQAPPPVAQGTIL